MRTALIVGGSGGIGIEICKALSADYRILLTCHTDESEAEARLKAAGIAHNLFKLDITDDNAVRELMASLISQNGNIDLVVYSVTPRIDNRYVFALTWSDFVQHLEVQVKGMLSIIKSMESAIKKGDGTHFILVLTEYCIGKPPVMLSHYITSKYALMGLGKCMAIELAKFKCRFNMVSPGIVNTGLNKGLPPKLLEIAAASNPLRRIAEPADVARVVRFLASEQSGYLNGVNIPVNGGNILV